MSMKIQTPGVHHIALRVSDYQRSRKFYSEVLGFKIALEQSNLFIFFAGGTAIAVRGPEDRTPPNDQFNPFRVGLDHLALGCENADDLKRIASELDRAGIENTGIKTDETLNKKYVAFKDPDRISWEYYMAT
jgi:glyoxylase I family protein